MIFVVDASVAIKWFVEESHHDEAVAISNESNRLVATDLVFAEVSNVMRRKARGGYISHEQAAVSVKNLAAAFKEIVPSSQLINVAFEYAARLDHSIYDVLYLACALRTPESLLVTANEKFRAKAVAAGVGEIVLSLEEAYGRLLLEQENRHG